MKLDEQHPIIKDAIKKWEERPKWLRNIIDKHIFKIKHKK